MAVEGLGIGFDEVGGRAIDLIYNFGFPLGRSLQIVEIHVGQLDTRIHPLRPIGLEQLHGPPQGLDRRERLLRFQLRQGKPIIGVAELLVLLYRGAVSRRYHRSKHDRSVLSYRSARLQYSCGGWNPPLVIRIQAFLMTYSSCNT